MWMPQGLTDDMSTLVQVMAWCRQATSHYLSQSWCRFMSLFYVTRPQWVKPPTFMIYMDNTVFMKIIGHIRYFWWLGPNVWWEISQIWIEYIKPIGQMSDEPWEFFGYSAILHICTPTNRRLFNSDNWNSLQVIFCLYWYSRNPL